MTETYLYVALPTEPRIEPRPHRSFALGLAVKNRQRMKKQVMEQARKKAFLHSAKPSSFV